MKYSIILIGALIFYLLPITSKGQLNEVIGFHLYEKNNYKRVRKHDLNELLPLEEIDLSSFKNVKSLSVLESCDYCDIKKLKIGLYISDFESLSSQKITKSLEMLDLSRSNYPLDHFNNNVFTKVETLNISGLSIKVQAIIISFPNLKTIIIRNAQYSTEDQSALEKAGIRILYDNLKPLPFQFNSFEIGKYKDYVTVGKIKKVMAVIKIIVNPKGEVECIENYNSNCECLELHRLLQKVLFFEPSEMTKNRIIDLPLRFE